MAKHVPSVVRVALAKRVAERWVRENSRAEYRLSVFGMGGGIRNLPSLMRSFRDGCSKLGSLESVSDLGIFVRGDRMDLRSADREKLAALDKWLTKKGCETSGVW